MKVQAESLGPAMRLGPGYETFWAYIPHFIHSPFYVYAYAFGDCLVNSLYGVYEKAQDGFAERYLAMLAAGGTKHHSELLAPFGLDATRSGLLEIGLSLIERMIDRAGGDGAGVASLRLRANAAAGHPRRHRQRRAPRPICRHGERDDERNRMSARAARYARVGRQCRAAWRRASPARGCSARDGSDQPNAAALTQALGGLKGPMMKVAQLHGHHPRPAAARIRGGAVEAPERGAADGPAFVKRRMVAELGPDWQTRFGSFELQPAAAASLGQVHRATAPGRPRAGLQAAISRHAVRRGGRSQQLELIFALHRRMDPAIDTREISKEIGARVREELDYGREAKHAALYARHAAAEEPQVRVPRVWPELSTRRLLTMTGSRASRCSSFKQRRLEERNRIATAMFKAWWHAVQPLRRDPRRSASRQLHGVLGGRRAAGHQPARFRLHPHLPAALRRRRGRSLSRACCEDDRDRVVHAYETWGFKGLPRSSSTS